MTKELSRNASFWVAAGVVAHTLWTSAAPAMSYPLYAREWQLSPTMTTAIFSIYPVVVVVTLITFGDISDYIGRRAAMLCGLASSILGVLLFAIAANLDMLFFGRIFMGIGVGLAAGPSTAALVDYAGNNASERASATTISAQAIGFAAALLTSGFLIQYGPFPIHLSFVVLLVLLTVLLTLAYFLPRDRRISAGRWSLRLPRVDKTLRSSFFLASITVMTAYTHGVTVGSLGSQFARELIQSSNVFINSAALSLFGIALGITGVFARKMEATLAAIAGTIISMLAMLLLVGAVVFHCLAFFIAMTSASGIAYALMVFGGLAMITRITPENLRGSTLSGVFLFAYLFTGALALFLGKIATVTNLSSAAFANAVIMTALCLLTIALLISHARRQTTCRHTHASSTTSA